MEFKTSDNSIKPIKSHCTVVSERVVLKTARTNVIGPVIYRIAHPSPLRGFTRIENQVSAHARAHRKLRTVL